MILSWCSFTEGGPYQMMENWVRSVSTEKSPFGSPTSRLRFRNMRLANDGHPFLSSGPNRPRYSSAGYFCSFFAILRRIAVERSSRNSLAIARA